MADGPIIVTSPRQYPTEIRTEGEIILHPRVASISSSFPSIESMGNAVVLPSAGTFRGNIVESSPDYNPRKDVTSIVETKYRNLGVEIPEILMNKTPVASPSGNFIIFASDPHFAEIVAKEADIQRQKIANKWFGQDIPNWTEPVIIAALDASNTQSSGVTNFTPKSAGHARHIISEVNGSRELILNSSLPHEVCHAITAIHLGKTLPRWADEAISSLNEIDSEVERFEKIFVDALRNKNAIKTNELLQATEYPGNNKQVTFYGQSISLAKFLISEGDKNTLNDKTGEQKFFDFVQDAMNKEGDKRWTQGVKAHYGYNSLGDLQDAWLDWLKKNL